MGTAADNGKRGAGGPAKKSRARDPRAVAKSPSAGKKAEDGVAFATASFLADLRLADGADRVLASLAMLVAEKIESAPAYALPKYASALRELLADLQRVERDERFEHKVAAAHAEHEAGVRRQKALLAELGVPDVTPEEVGRRSSA
jgi:hypothetical protein